MSSSSVNCSLSLIKINLIDCRLAVGRENVCSMNISIMSWELLTGMNSSSIFILLKNFHLRNFYVNCLPFIFHVKYCVDRVNMWRLAQNYCKIDTYSIAPIFACIIFDAIQFSCCSLYIEDKHFKCNSYLIFLLHKGNV